MIQIEKGQSDTPNYVDSGHCEKVQILVSGEARLGVLQVQGQ